MSIKQEDMAKPNISPVLFMAVDGEPMSFFLRPGPAKRKLQPLITAGGGMLCSVQQPRAILLLDPVEGGSVAETTAHWYVSTQYIYDCIEKDEQLNLEDYRLNPEVVQRQSARLNNNRESSPGLLGGRVAYTAEDDAAILSYVSKHMSEVGGNRLWQDMEKQRVTSHSWQSMKYRYRVRLAKKQSEVVEGAEENGAEEDAKVAERETKVEGNQEAEPQKPMSAEDPASPHTAESDVTQIEAQSIAVENRQPEVVEAQTSTCSQGEVQHVTPQTDKEPDESTKVVTVEAETYNSPQPEVRCLDSPADAHPIPAESTEPETDGPQTVVPPQKESVPEDSPCSLTKSLPDTSSQKEPKEKSSPRPHQQQRRSTRRQLQLEESSPESYGKKLRSASSFPEQLSSSPQSLKKTKSAIKSPSQQDTTVDQPPSKKARGKSVAAVADSQQEESGQAAVSEATLTAMESVPTPRKGVKRKEKRKLGILEMATKEFESESDEDKVSDLQSPAETVTVQPISTEPSLPTPATAASTQSNPEPGPSLQENVQETQDSHRNCLAVAGCAEPAATEVVDTTSKAHLFIFESESQEEDSQSSLGENPAPPADPQPTVNKDSAFSLTQSQLEEDKQRIRELMQETNQDLVSVTKALLKTSGDFSDARELLLNPLSMSGPCWQCYDDDLLLAGDPVIQQQLKEKYGLWEGWSLSQLTMGERWYPTLDCACFWSTWRKPTQNMQTPHRRAQIGI
uniref:telomeric repeat-binding factor 2-interacting protein 1 isoform X2 n=1 Tax=Scatophagus argus TaxID=75038 RepID=UPI001ED8505C|nr:telomeric repeat-binding factor 2-interacting protein 1 isoform X2 [Scatophagus argus]XP_046239277.1 telomeric repeat-binding factor 2-interacting protein 1 isoform X2 [Scatophagus argus]